MEISIKHLFQEEFAKMVAVISNHFGLQHIGIAEDIVSETFLLASETWGIKGVPENPPAWLYTVATNKAKYHFRRKKIFEQKVVPQIKSVRDEYEEMPELNFSSENIKDSQLQMLFAICTPAIASEAQIGLALRVLCGFGIDEIAEAFLSNKETINKRLFRAKEKLRGEKIAMELPPENEIEERLSNVLRIIYLLFNEGYYSATQNEVLRKEFCVEAMRLGIMLTVYDKTNLPETNALMALMCFHASRFDARQNEENTLVLYEEQDETLWDQDLIKKGQYFLNLSARGNEVTSYHLEAGIAYWHCIKEDSRKKWEEILRLYDRLLLVNYSPGVALNRIYALYKAKGGYVALEEVKKLNVANNHFYFLLLAELYKGIDRGAAKANLEKALAQARTDAEKEVISAKLRSLR